MLRRNERLVGYSASTLAPRDTANDPLRSIRLGIFSGYSAFESWFKEAIDSGLLP